MNWAKWRHAILAPLGQQGLSVSPNTVFFNPDAIWDHPFIHLLPGLIHGFDKEGMEAFQIFLQYLLICVEIGHPAYWEKSGVAQANFGKLMQNFSLDQLYHIFIILQESAVLRMEYASQRFGKKVTQGCVIMDMKGLTMSLDSNATKNTKRTLEALQNYYPERLKRLFLINCPWYFSGIFALFKPFIDKKTSDKFVILGADYLPTLEQYFERSEIPADLGGAFQCERWGMASESSGLSPEYVAQWVVRHSFASTDAITQRMTEEERQAAYECAVASVTLERFPREYLTLFPCHEEVTAAEAARDGPEPGEGSRRSKALVRQSVTFSANTKDCANDRVSVCEDGSLWAEEGSRMGDLFTVAAKPGEGEVKLSHWNESLL